MSQTKNSSDKVFAKMVSVMLESSYHTDVCSIVHLSDKFGFNKLLEVIKWGYGDWQLCAAHD